MKRRALVLFFTLLFCLAFPLSASANSAEPPCLTVLVAGAPKDLTLSLEFDDSLSLKPVVLTGEPKAWEVYYRFNYYNVSFNYSDGRSFWEYGPEGLTGAQLVVDTGEETFSLPIDPTGFSRYNNLLTLNLSSRTLTNGQPWWRMPLLIFLRVGLTLFLEGLIFFLFGYRDRRSWTVFLVVNLITQLGVNLCIHLLFPVTMNAYTSMLLGVFFYTPMEIVVLLVEMAAFALLLKEQRKRKAVGYAAVANLFSWALGGWLLTALPL